MHLDNNTLEREYTPNLQSISFGMINKTEEIQHLNELELYFVLESCNREMWFTLCSQGEPKSEDDIERIINEIVSLNNIKQVCLLQTAMFGTDAHKSETGVTVETGPLFAKWYAFYNNHCKDTFENVQPYIEAKKSGKDISQYLPEGDWKDYVV